MKVLIGSVSALLIGFVFLAFALETHAGTSPIGDVWCGGIRHNSVVILDTKCAKGYACVEFEYGAETRTCLGGQIIVSR